MKIVILGCGRMGAMLAGRLCVAGHEVSVIDWDSTQFQRLGSEYTGKKIEGNGTEQDVLRKAGIETADVFVAITQGDNRNIMASEIAFAIFHVPCVHTRIKDPMRAECYAEAGLKTFCTTIICADNLEKDILKDVVTNAPAQVAPSLGKE